MDGAGTVRRHMTVSDGVVTRAPKMQVPIQESQQGADKTEPKSGLAHRWSARLPAWLTPWAPYLIDVLVLLALSLAVAAALTAGVLSRSTSQTLTFLGASICCGLTSAYVRLATTDDQ